VSFVLGLTGSIGMGKTVTAGLFRRRGIPVHDADAAVHALYAGRAAGPVEAAFPGVVEDGRVDRAELGRRVFGDAEAMRRLEAIVHPLVREEEAAFLARHGSTPLVVLDIPLLLETASRTRCDAVVVVSAPEDVQRQRVLSRPGMSEERFAAIMARQMPDGAKRRLAHAVIDTGRGVDAAQRQVDDLIRALVGRAGRRQSRARSPI
jgi:dephospho-CoA kinase